MAFTTLVSTEALAGYSGTRHLVVLDCRFALTDVHWGERAYLEGHLPGAHYADLARDLSGEQTGTNGRHPLPTAADLERTFGRFGIDEHAQVVVYDQDSGMFASRCWWLLRWAGHRQAAVLDGGFAKWTREQRPVASGPEPAPPRRPFHGRFNPAMIVDAAGLEAALARPGALRLVDARAPERFRGDVEPIDRVPGHIPGAVNHFHKDTITGEGVFRDREELRRSFEATLAGRSAEDVVCYCGSGVTACQDLLAMEHAGLSGAKLYPGSWSEWSSDPSRPVARGDVDPSE
jgi:thiosulfate/3-mercaptopyruvate sulfurtransferase